MNNKAFYNLTYGVFLLATKAEEKANACIVNTRRAGRGEPCARGGFRAEYELHLRAY
jgi:hypothetical protein